MFSIYEMILFLLTGSFCMIGAVIVAGSILMVLIDLIQEKIIKRFFPSKYYYDWDEEI